MLDLEVSLVERETTVTMAQKLAGRFSVAASASKGGVGAPLI